MKRPDWTSVIIGIRQVLESEMRMDSPMGYRVFLKEHKLLATWVLAHGADFARKMRLPRNGNLAAPFWSLIKSHDIKVCAKDRAVLLKNMRNDLAQSARL